MSKYNIADLLDDVREASQQAVHNIDYRARRNNTLQLLQLANGALSQVAQLINFTAEYNQDNNHENIKNNLVKSVLASLGAFNISDIYEIYQHYSSNGIHEGSKFKTTLREMDLVPDGLEQVIPACTEEALCGVGAPHAQLLRQLEVGPMEILKRKSADILILTPEKFYKKSTLEKALSTFSFVIVGGNTYVYNIAARDAK